MWLAALGHPPKGRSGSAGLEGQERCRCRTQDRARAALFGSQAPSAAHFLVSFAFFSEIIFLQVPANHSVTQATALRSIRGPDGHQVWPLPATSLPGIPFQPPPARGPDSWSRMGGRHQCCQLAFVEAPLCQALQSTIQSPPEPRARGGHCPH